MIRMKKSRKKQYDNQMCQREYWLEMHEKENQKYEKKFLQKFTKIRNYEKDDYSDEAIMYRAALKYHKRAAAKKVEELLLRFTKVFVIFLFISYELCSNFHQDKFCARIGSNLNTCANIYFKIGQLNHPELKGLLLEF